MRKAYITFAVFLCVFLFIVRNILSGMSLDLISPEHPFVVPVSVAATQKVSDAGGPPPQQHPMAHASSHPPWPPHCPHDMLPFYILQLNTSEQEVATALRRVHPLPSYCHMLGPMDGYCMELSLHAAMRSHPCRVDNLKNASMVWLETYFIAHKIANNINSSSGEVKGIGSGHFSAWLERLKKSHHAHIYTRQYFMYYPNWKRPPSHMITAKNQKWWPNQMFVRMNIVSHSIGMSAETPIECHKTCVNSLRKYSSYVNCVTILCPDARQGLRIGAENFVNRSKRHISIPHYEPKCTAIVPSYNGDGGRPIRLMMSGRWADHINRICIRRSFEKYWHRELDPNANWHESGGLLWGNSSVVLSDMRRAVFCIETQGDSLNTRRLTDAVLCGCIPVIACNDCVYPYAHLLKGFTVRIPDRDISDIVATVMAIDNATIARLQDGVRAVRSMFVSPDCGREKSTMADQVVREMALRVRGLLDGTITTDFDRAPLN